MLRKLFSSFTILVFFACSIIFIVECSEVKEASSNETAISEKKPSYDSFFSDELSWKDGIGQAFAFSGLLIGGFIILGGLAWLLVPVLGYRFCSFFGNCEPQMLAYSNGGNLQDSNQANGYSDMYNPMVMAGYRKRSLKYVGPLLKTLASAYEKFDQQTPSTTKTE